MRKTKYLTIFMFAYLASNLYCYARIGETEFESSQRYGQNDKKKTNDIVFPILKEIPQSITRTYHYQGWLIRAAYYNGRTVRINYSKKDNSSLQKDEILAILQAEALDGKWTESIGSLNPITRLQEAAKYRDKWNNSNGSIAYLHGNNSILTIDSPEVEITIRKLKEKKELERKTNIPRF